MGHLTRMESSDQKFQAKSGSNRMKEKLPERFQRTGRKMKLTGLNLM